MDLVALDKDIWEKLFKREMPKQYLQFVTEGGCEALNGRVLSESSLSGVLKALGSVPPDGDLDEVRECLPTAKFFFNAQQKDEMCLLDGDGSEWVPLTYMDLWLEWLVRPKDRMIPSWQCGETEEKEAYLPLATAQTDQDLDEESPFLVMDTNNNCRVLLRVGEEFLPICDRLSELESALDHA